MATNACTTASPPQPNLASAQHTGTDTVNCLERLRATDSVSAVVQMSVRPQDQKAKLPPDFEGLFVQEFKARLKVPGILPLTVMQGLAPCDTVQGICAGGAMVLGSKAYATAHQNGTLSGVSIVDRSLTPVFSDSVKSVLIDMSNQHLIPFFQSSASIPIEVTIGAEEKADTIPRERWLFYVLLPRYRLPFRHANWSAQSKPPRYPFRAELAGIGDTLDFTFTVLPNGKVAAASLDLLIGRYRDFVEPVLISLARSTFTPAQIGECRVAERVKRRFIFAGGR